MIYILDTRTYTQKSINVNFAMALLKHIRAAITAILLIAMLTITVTTSSQPVFVFAPWQCGDCGDFLKLTAQFEKAVIGAINPPEPEKIA